MFAATARHLAIPRSSTSWAIRAIPFLLHVAVTPAVSPHQQLARRTLHCTLLHLNNINSHNIKPDAFPDRTWIDNFKRSDIPDTSYDLSFARSSGPGGQNVNKLNTKALLRLPLDPPPAWLPPYCLDRLLILQSTKINKAGDLLISSDKFRTQRQNIDECIDKLYAMITEAGYIPRETSAQQRKKVAGLAKADKERRLEGKKVAGKKKADRKVSRDF